MHQNQVAIVTGASGGIGRAIAVSLAEAGYDVVITYRRSPDGARETVRLIEKQGRQALAVSCDLARVIEIEALFRQVRDTYGRIDVLVNNASISNTLPVEAIDEAEWDNMLDINLKGTFFCSKLAFQVMKEAGKGRIISITSIAGQRGGYYSGIHYSTSKGGVETMMKCFALLGAPCQVTANCVSPGVVATEMARSEGLSPEGIPLGRMAAPEEIAAAVTFLASGQAGYITGATIDVNGGQLMR